MYSETTLSYFQQTTMILTYRIQTSTGWLETSRWVGWGTGGHAGCACGFLVYSKLVEFGQLLVATTEESQPSQQQQLRWVMCNS